MIMAPTGLEGPSRLGVHINYKRRTHFNPSDRSGINCTFAL
jgi:hypothetical protein